MVEIKHPKIDANYSTNAKDCNLYIVVEGEVYGLDDAPGWLNENNWLSDWIFIAAADPDTAVKVAARVDTDGNHRVGRIYTKYLRLQEFRSKLLAEGCFTAKEIFNHPEASSIVFNSSWIKIT